MISCTPLQQKILGALQASVRVGAEDERSLQAEAEALDEAYFLAAEAEQGAGLIEFSLARLGEALAFALHAVEHLDASTEAVYEAAMVSDDPGVVLAAAFATLQ